MLHEKERPIIFGQDDDKEFNNLLKDPSEWVFELQQINWRPTPIMKEDADEDIELFGKIKSIFLWFRSSFYIIQSTQQVLGLEDLDQAMWAAIPRVRVKTWPASSK